MDGCLFNGNTADNDGGALWLMRDYGSSITNCSFQSNTAGAGGAIYTGWPPDQGPVSLVAGCSFRGNSAYGGAGGAVCADLGGLIRLENCLVASNPGGIALFTDYTGQIDLSCSNVFGNTPTNYGGDLSDQTGLNGNISLDPLFCEPAGEDFTVADLSPCLPAHNDCGVLMGAHGEGCTLTASDPAPAAGHALGASYPNPFNPSTRIDFTLSEATEVRLEVFSLDGRRVATLLSGALPAGPHSATWRGEDDAGAAQPSGVYFYRLSAGDWTESRRMLLLK